MSAVSTPHVDPPEVIHPDVRHLSVSSIRTFITCPESWRRRYIEHEFEPSNGNLVLGSAVGAAAGHNFAQKIETEVDLPESDVLDLYSDEFDYKVETSDVDWGEDKPGAVKDVGSKVLAVYHRLTAPKVQPTSTEREFALSWDEVGWTFRGFLDFEEANGDVGDHKTAARAWTPAKADADVQATAYLAVRRAEGNPAPRFGFHQLVKVKSPDLRHVEPVYTTRTDAQLDFFEARLFAIAAEMRWRIERDVWGYAEPGSWKCGPKYCGYWATCPAGGGSL